MSSSFLTGALYVSLVICALGLAWRVSCWLRTEIGPDARSAGAMSRAVAIAATLACAPFGRRALSVLGAFALDALLLRRLFAQNRLRAIAHHLLLASFTWLLLMHALAPVVTSSLFPGYQPTLEPWLFLRDLFGAIALAAVLLLAVARRRSLDAGSRKQAVRESMFVALLVVVLVSGFVLEAQKIASPLAFERMADRYAAASDADARAGLRAWWAREFGVPYQHADARLDDASAAKGKALHDEACASCHAKPAFAFVSWPLSRLLVPLASSLDTAGAGAWLLHLHALAIVAGVATLPFTRFFHAIAAPFAMLFDAVARSGSSPNLARTAALRSVRRAVALDACVRCGLCDTTCSVAPMSRWLDNDSLLPSRKVRIVGDIAHGRLPLSGNVIQPIRGEVLRAAEGAFLCTDCARCTSNCPVNLDLTDLWEAGRRDLAAAGLGPPEQWIGARTPLAWAEALRTEGADARASSERLASERAIFARCIQCQACTSVCPVVAHGADGHADLTLQRVMNLLRLGRGDLALGSRMVLACAACYQCEEHCPEGIPVARIMLELRSMAVNRLGAVREREAAS